MKLKIFTFRFSDEIDGFDDDVLQNFISDKQVVEFNDHFYVHDKTPYLTIVLSYRHFGEAVTGKKRVAENPAKELDEAEKAIYEELRTWRAIRAKQEGIPPYLIAHNRQFAKAVKLRARSKSDLAKITGMGEAKIGQYGEDILTIITRHLESKVSEKPVEESKHRL